VRDTWLGPPIWLGLYAGLRVSEVQALRWHAVDFQNDVIRIVASYNRKEKRLQDHPKQKNHGRVPMTPALRKFLMELKLRSCGCEWVAPNSQGGMLEYSSFSRALKLACKSEGLHQLTTHELRHSCTELWIEAGASTEDIRRLLNQKSLSATERYIHRTDERLNHIATKLG
jgi:integrase